jgi:hypothetical protein
MLAILQDNGYQVKDAGGDYLAVHFSASQRLSK